MNYYERLKEEVKAWSLPLVKSRDELIKIIETAKKSLTTEKGIVQNLKARIEKLKDMSKESLTNVELDFAKFKTSLKKLNSELEVSESACEMLQNEILPQKQKELQDVRRQLNGKFDASFLQHKPVNDEQVYALLEKVYDEKCLFAAAFHRLRQEAGCGDSSYSLPPGRRQYYKAFEVFRVAKRTLPKQPVKPATDNARQSGTLITGNIEPVTVEHAEEKSEPVAVET